MTPGVIAYTLTTSMGIGNETNMTSLRSGQSGLKPVSFDGAETIETYTGMVDLEAVVLPAELKTFDCRNNRLAYLALMQDEFITRVNDTVETFGADRIGVILGTSTSGIRQTELAYRSACNGEELGSLPADYCYENTHNIHSVTRFTRQLLGLKGYSLTISTACSSSAKVFASARRALDAGLCHAVLVGGVDSLCETTLHGFHSLQLVSSLPCSPCDEGRQGISIGEAGGFALLTSEEADIRLVGTGESSDAHHMSSPHPKGKGAFLSMEAALSSASLSPPDIDYINLHGTGTPANDTVECAAVSQLFGNSVPCSSTKGFTGHTLGACGIVESIFGFYAIAEGFLPININTTEVDSNIAVNIVTESIEQPVDCFLTNSFGFGGSNCSLVFEA